MIIAGEEEEEKQTVSFFPPPFTPEREKVKQVSLALSSAAHLFSAANSDPLSLPVPLLSILNLLLVIIIKPSP